MTLKARLAAGEICLGLWLGLGSDASAELAGGIGFDWCLIDAEHGPNDLSRIESQLRALATTDTLAVVRVPAGEDWIIKQVLDLGAQTILVPLVNTGAEAQQVARAMRYPPDGHRGMGAALARASGFNAQTDYATTANADICCLVQVETVEAIENLDAIVEAEGVDGVFLGPADLSADMGYPGQLDHPKVDAVIDDALARIVAKGKAAGIITFDPSRIAKYKKMGVSFLGIGADVISLRNALKTELGAARDA